MTRQSGQCLRHTPPPASWDPLGQCRDCRGSSLQSEKVLTNLFTEDSSDWLYLTLHHVSGPWVWMVSRRDRMIWSKMSFEPNVTITDWFNTSSWRLQRLGYWQWSLRYRMQSSGSLSETGRWDRAGWRWGRAARCSVSPLQHLWILTPAASVTSDSCHQASWREPRFPRIWCVLTPHSPGLVSHQECEACFHQL